MTIGELREEISMYSDDMVIGIVEVDEDDNSYPDRVYSDTFTPYKGAQTEIVIRFIKN